MAKSSTRVEIGKRKLELSNLKKILYPKDGIVKAQVIEYYLKIAPTILSHIKGRPLTLVRFPDGIEGERFYQKNRPDWAPDWIEYETLGKEAKDYMIATEAASLVWLANLACLELHQMHSRRPNFDKPDYMVFDIDPPEGYEFTKVVDLALRLRQHVESYGYATFPKTTGGKGIHILCPVEVKYSFDEVFQTAKGIAEPFVKKNEKETTLQIRKEARKGRVLIDVFRIRQGQSIISPYSMRGVSGAPVSMPLSWEEIEATKKSTEWNINTAMERVLQEGDAWEGINAYATSLHTKLKGKKIVKNLGPNSKYKTPETLESYKKKRDFRKTPEPDANYAGGDGNGFVIHRHHASHLHYDLRLEQDGVLKSWAVPRGMPPRPGIKRLAVATEDHPMKYLNWEGTIPKGQYGGGDMWIYSLGKYEIVKEKKNGFYFNLYSKDLNGEFRMHLMKKKEWLLERVNNPQINYLQDPIEFMLSTSEEEPPKGDYFYEVKWDGIRVMISLDEGEIRIRSRSQRDITAQFPELLIPEEAFRATCGLFDAEIVCLDEKGRPDFKKVIHRLMQSTESGIKKGAARNPVYCYFFDCLYLDGRPIVNEPLWRRKDWLKDAIKPGTAYRVSEIVEEGEELFEAAKKMELEGIMSKDPESRYLPGKRSNSWIKIKVRNTVDCVIVGYTEGKGDRKKYFGALQIIQINNGDPVYRGKVGSGFDSKLMKSIMEELEKLKKIKNPKIENPVDPAVTTWVEPKLFCEVQYAMITNNETFREPVFIRMRPDLEE
jgi:DNA ligase D-like protein (predicted ligase)/DNA ligase D-like protein (predicted polymerase)/DNA ligase D-like protein (predicted 3'-phosphoesterase)